MARSILGRAIYILSLVHRSLDPRGLASAILRQSSYSSDGTFQGHWHGPKRYEREGIVHGGDRRIQWQFEIFFVVRNQLLVDNSVI